MQTDESQPRLSRPAGLYLHIPFCSAICPYCDFSVVVGRRERRKAFVETLLTEIIFHAATRWQFDTVYFGGGTPSLLETEDLERLIQAIRETFDLRSGTRIFFEANPEDVTWENLAAWQALGVDFLSLGVQSLDARDLRYLGRRHTAEESRTAIERALEAGFDTVSVDLIYGLPHHDLASWSRILETVVSLGPQHLSCYELEIHPRTTFGKLQARGDLDELDSDTQADLFLHTHRYLAEVGYQGYEVSNFARSPEYRSAHNTKYWDHTSYLGLGPSAHSFDGRRRWWNERLIPHWEKKIQAGFRPDSEDERLTPQQFALEAIMLGLRTSDGVDLAAVQEQLNVELVERNAAVVRMLEQQKLARRHGRRLVLTLDGLLVADRLASMFEA